MPDNRTRPLSSYYTHPKLPSHLDKIPIAEVWQEYQATRSVQSRNHLVLNYFVLVEKQAKAIARRLPHKVDVEDLISAGIFGLIESIEEFELEREVDFKAYSYHRIRGAIRDELRSMDWAPRRVRDRESEVDNVKERVKLRTGVPATEKEIARGLGITLKEFLEKRSQYKNSISSDSEPKEMVPLAYKIRDTDELMYFEPKYDRTNTLDERLTLRELRHAVRGLTKQEKAIVILRYTNERTMEEIARALNVSQPRISQAHKRMLEKLERKCA